MVHMRNQYPIFSTALLVATTLTLPALGQQNSIRMLPPKPVTSTEVRLNDFALPPHPIELVSLSANPAGGLRYQTLMPVAGRMAATTDAAKLRGALAPPAGVYAYTGAVDASGQAPPVSAAVFGPPDARVKVAPDTPVDWAVWGTNNNDGPLRLPFGGGYDLLSAQLPASVLSRQITQVSFGISGSGLNYANYSLYPRYTSLTRFIDPGTGRISSRREDTTPQESVNRAKLPRYIAVEGETPGQRGQVITLSPTRFEGVATRFVEGDKNASARQISLLTFDDAGNLLKDQPINFPYNRKLSVRLPVHDAKGQVVGTFSVFADGGGKKDARDPQENRFSVVITDELGAIWSQFEWVNGEGSNRAIVPTYILRKGDNLLVYNTNQQKLIKPVEESWLLDKAGKATLVNSMPSGEVAKHSTQVIDTPTGVVSGGQRTGWSSDSGAHYLDSFTDANGEVWLLLQRQADAPGGSSAPASAPAPSSTTSRLLGFANKLNQMTGQTPPAVAPMAVATESGKMYSDVFVLQFDADLKLKGQTVIDIEPMPNPIRFQRSVRPIGADYVLSNAATTRISIRPGAAPDDRLTVQRLSPYQSVRLSSPDINNFLLDETIGKIYVLYGVIKKPELGGLLTYTLD